MFRTVELSPTLADRLSGSTGSVGRRTCGEANDTTKTQIADGGSNSRVAIS
jgi:hypothetical protein